MSQHLRTLEHAGLAAVRPQGRTRVYRLGPRGLEARHADLNGFWQAALEGLAEHARRGGA